MRYLTGPKYRKYVKGYGFLLLAKIFGDKYGKKLMYTATKTGIDAAKTVSNRVVWKATETTGDLIESEVADKITLAGKPKEDDETKKEEEIYISLTKKTTNYWWLKIVLNIECNFHNIKMEFQKIVNLLETTSDDKDLPRFVTKKCIEVYDQSKKKLQCQQRSKN